MNPFTERFLTSQDTMGKLDDIGWCDKDDIPSEYPAHYRNNQRLIVLDKAFAWNLFLRLMPHFTDKELIGVKVGTFSVSLPFLHLLLHFLPLFFFSSSLIFFRFE